MLRDRQDINYSIISCVCFSLRLCGSVRDIFGFGRRPDCELAARSTKRLLALLLLLAFMSDPLCAAQPNIILFLADDMGMGDTSAYQDWSGNADRDQLHTPALERLANRGIRFTDAHSPSSRCSPSRYALLTGRYCWRTHLKHWVLFGVQVDPLIERERVTLPEFLQDAAYRTGMVGKWHLGLKYHNRDGGIAEGWEDADLTKPIADGPLDHGFDFYYGISRSHGTSGPDGEKGKDPKQSRGPGWIHNRKIVGATGTGKALDGSYRLDRVGDVLDEQAFAFLERANKEAKPFFLYFASPANHAPYTPSVKLGKRAIAAASRNVDGSLTHQKRLDFIYQNDVHIARLLDHLKTTADPRRPGKALIANTLFIFTSDNGSENGNKQFTGPLRSNKGSTYDGGHRVPFIASWPAGGVGDGNAETPGDTSERLLSLTDMFATIAEILAKPLPPLKGNAYGAEDSVSQLAALRGKAFRPRIPIFPNDHKEASKRKADKRAWVAVRSNAAPLPGKWKLFLDHHFAFDQELNPKELYKIDDDPMEATNLLNHPPCQTVIDFLLKQASLAAGDDGSTRHLQQ